jgi:hypothetical protein
MRHKGSSPPSNDAITFAGTAAVMSVSIRPGVTALTVSPMPPRESLSALPQRERGLASERLDEPNRPDFEAA